MAMKEGNAMRLMVVDDDKQIREGITYGIQWENLGIDEAVCFKDGFDALAGAKLKSFDIALLDISMPGMTGIELLQELKKLSPQIAVVLISGFEEFEYARMGMRYGALDYISKPIHLDELTKTVSEVAEKCRKERKDADIVGETERNAFVQKLFHGVKLQTKEVKAFLTGECGFSQSGVFLGVLLRSDVPDALFLDEECFSIVVRKMTEYLGGSQHRYFQVGKEEWYLLIHTVDSALYIFNLKTQVRRMLEKINEELPAGRGISAAIVAPFDAAGLAGSYHKASAMLERTFFEGAKCCLEEGGIRGEYLKECVEKSAGGIDGHVTENGGSKENGGLKENGGETLARLHGQCIRQFHLFSDQELEEWVDAVQKELYKGTKSAAQSFIQVNLAELLSKHAIGGREEWQGNIFDAVYFDEMMLAWRKCLQNLKEEVNGISGYSKEVRQVMGFVKEHYAEKISVEQIAEKMEISAGHLSRMFKAETGNSLKKYINKVRIDQATYLLQNTNMKVYEVAESVGIPDYLYFSQVFKNVTSKTPLEVRKETQGNERR